MRITIMALALVLLFTPVIYVFGQLWSSTGSTGGLVAAERAAVAYGRPLTKLLSALIDAQYAAAEHKTAIDANAVKAAVAEVDRVDRRSDDVAHIRQRWARLTQEIDRALATDPGRSGALHAYATPIALTQALLHQTASSAEASGDPGLGSHYLLDVALHLLPGVSAAAGETAALAVESGSSSSARSAARPDARLAVAEDRLARAAGDVLIVLRASEPVAGDPADLSLLGPLDEFAAATDGLSRAAGELYRAGGPGTSARDHIGAATVRVKAAAFALDMAVLNAFDAQLTASAEDYGAQRLVLLLAALLIALAVGVLLWLLLPGSAEPVSAAAGEMAQGRHRDPAEGGDVVPEGSALIPMDARELLAPALGRADRVAQADTRQGNDDRQ